MIVQSPVFGSLSGKLAGTVASRTYGQNVVRSKPLTVNQPDTDAQKLAKAKFAAAGIAVKQLMTFFSFVFSASKLKMPVISYVVGYFRKNGIAGTLNAITYDWSKLAPVSDSKGIASFFTAVKSVANKVTVNWSAGDFAGIYGENAEIHLLLIEDSESGLTKSDSKKALDSETHEFTITGTNTSKTFFLYIYVVDPDLPSQSPSELAMATL